MSDVAKPKSGWAQSIATALIVAALVALPNYFLVTRELSVKVDGISKTLDALTPKVEETQKVTNTVKTTLDEGIRQSLASQDKRLTVAEDRLSKLSDQIYELRLLANQLQVLVENIRRASEVPPSPRR